MTKKYSFSKKELREIRPFWSDAQQYYRAAQAMESVVKNYIQSVVMARLNLSPDTEVSYDLNEGVLEVREVKGKAPDEVVEQAKKQGKNPIERK